MECEVNRSETNLTECSVVEENSDNDTEEAHLIDKAKSKVRHSSDVYIAQGAYSDCDNILAKFLSLKTSTFEDFIALWKERKFSRIFDGRESYAELLEFTEEVMAIAKSFILPPHSQIKRIGALYLMYGLYTQQPLRGDVKFRVTPQEWSVILKFVENLKANGFIDANYIFHKMSLEGAFLTVACSKEYGLERNFRKYLMPWPARDQELDPCSIFSLETLMSCAYRGSLKAAADKCRSKYNSIKNKLRAGAGSAFQSVEGTERGLEQIVQENIDYVIDSSVNNPSTRKFSNIGSGRQQLKEKAFQLQTPQMNVSVVANLNPENDTSSVQSENLNLHSNEDSTLPESDSSDSDFEYMMKPPSKRNSRKIKNQKLRKNKRKLDGKSPVSKPPKNQTLKNSKKQEKVTEESQSSVPNDLANHKRRASYQEISELKIGRKVQSKSQLSIRKKASCSSIGKKKS